jgi:hypothetical protein
VHLLERVEALRNDGMDEGEAQERAVRAFGAPGRVARQFAAAHDVQWDNRRFLIGMLQGAALAWVAWLLATFPIVLLVMGIYPSSGIPVVPSTSGASWWQPPLLALASSTPVTPGVVRYLDYLGWRLGPWGPMASTVLGVFQSTFAFRMGLLLLLFAIVPYRWGMRTRQWQRAGTAYGLGAWGATLVPILVLLFVSYVVFDPYTSVQYALQLAGQLLLLPVALVASGLGSYDRARSGGLDPRQIATG